MDSSLFTYFYIIFFDNFGVFMVNCSFVYIVILAFRKVTHI